MLKHIPGLFPLRAGPIDNIERIAAMLNENTAAKTEKGSESSLEKARRELKPYRFIMLTIAGIINAVGVTIFLFPIRLYDSGISGLSMLLDQVTPPHLTLSLFLLVLNVPIFLFGMRKQGFAFTVYSIYTVAVFSIASFLIKDVLPIDVRFFSPLAGSDHLLCAVFGGLLSGTGSGMTIRYGGAVDGIDVLSVIFAKQFGISLGTFVMVFNTVLYTVCGIVIQSWILPLYSILTYYVGSKTVDFIVEGLDRSKCAMVVTDKAAEISGALAERFGAAGTIIRAVGGYSGKEKGIVFFIVNQFQIGRFNDLVLDIDKSAFITLQDVSDVIKRAQ